MRKGYTHAKDAPCPLAVHDFPQGRFGTCCSLNAEPARSHLIAFDEWQIAERFCYSLSAERALVLADDLRRTAERLEAKYRDVRPLPEGARYIGYWHKSKTERIWRRRSTFSEALAAIREAATWLELVAHLGCGVLPR